MTYYIYKATNIKNQKIYIGRTLNFFSRLKSHKKKSSLEEDNCFHEAIKESGIENFVWQVIATTEDIEEAKYLEEKYIIEFDSLIPNGYNVSRGNAPTTVMVPVVRLTLDGEFVKEYASASDTEKDGFWATAVLKVCRGKQAQTMGFIFMLKDDYLREGPRKYVKPTPYQLREVYQCDLNGNLIQKFKSVNEAADSTGTCRTTVSGNLNGAYKTANGYIFVYPENYPIKDLEAHKQRTKGRKVYAVDKQTGEIELAFDSVADAGRYLNKNYKVIHCVLDKPNKSAFGYRWISQ